MWTGDHFLSAWYEAALTTVGLFWTGFWAFCFGYLVSSMIEVFVTQEKMQQLMGKEGISSVCLAAIFGCISSSCSFAALAGGRALFTKGAGLVPSLAFVLSSTNLVIELAIMIAIFLSWQFIVGEYVGGVFLIIIMWGVVALTKKCAPIEEAREHAIKQQQQEGGGGHHHHHGGGGGGHEHHHGGGGGGGGHEHHHGDGGGGGGGGHEHHDGGGTGGGGGDEHEHHHGGGAGGSHCEHHDGDSGDHCEEHEEENNGGGSHREEHGGNSGGGHGHCEHHGGSSGNGHMHHKHGDTNNDEDDEDMTDVEQGDDSTANTNQKQEQKQSAWKSKENWAQVAMGYFMEWQMIWKDVTVGFTAAGIISAFVPNIFFQWVFVGGINPNFGGLLEQTLVGPVVAVFTFICSMGNVPLAAVLYSNGVSYGGIIAFIFSDLISIPLLRVNAKYYGWTMSMYIAGVFFCSIVPTAIIVHYIFKASGALPSKDSIQGLSHRTYFALNYTFGLNMVFLAITILMFGWNFRDNGFPKFSLQEALRGPLQDVVLFCLAVLSLLWVIGGLFAGLKNV